MPRRFMVAVVGDNSLAAHTPGAAGDEDKKRQVAEQIGRLLVDAGHRVLTGGLGGVMDAAMAGARSSEAYREGATIAVLPSDDGAGASRHADIVIPTGLGSYRNGIVGRADAVVAVGGGAGTLIECATAWKARRPLVVMRECSGLSAALAGQRLDAGRGDGGRQPVLGAATPEEAVRLVGAQLAMPRGPAAAHS